MNNRLEITVTANKCLNCDACPHTLFETRYRELYPKGNVNLTTSKFIRCLSSVPTDTRIDWSGFSEPFFNEHTIEMMLYANSAGYSQSLYTTLMGLSMDKFEQLQPINFNPFVIHIPDVETRTPIKITNTYKRFLSYISTTHKVTAYSVHGTIPHEIKDLLDKNVPIITYLHDRANNIKNKEYIESNKTNGKVSCSYTGYGLNQNVLLPNGHVSLCCMDFGLENIIGDLSTETWDKIHNGAQIEHVRMRMDSNNDCICNYCERGKINE